MTGLGQHSRVVSTGEAVAAAGVQEAVAVAAAGVQEEDAVAAGMHGCAPGALLHGSRRYRWRVPRRQGAAGRCSVPVARQGMAGQRGVSRWARMALPAP